MIDGAGAQIAATATMLMAMNERSFVVTIAYIKTEPIQVAIFGLIFLGDAVTWPMMSAILVATAGVIVMSFKPGGMVGGIRPTVIGLVSGGLFALSAIGYRGAILNLGLPNFVMAATFTLVVGLVMQAVTLSIFLWLRQPTGMMAILRSWKPSLFAGLMGALASQFWFLAFAIATAGKCAHAGLDRGVVRASGVALHVRAAHDGARSRRHGAGRRRRAVADIRRRLKRRTHRRAPGSGGTSRRSRMTEPTRAASKISLVLADVDGTLVTAEKVLTVRARAAVEALHTAGLSFAITSGRPPRGMAMLIEPLAMRTPLAGFNGGIFVKPDMTIMEEHVLAADVARRAIEVILRNDMDVWVYSGNDWLVRNRNAPHVAREQWTVKFAPTIVENFKGALDSAVKIVGVSDDTDLVARCEKQVQDALGATASAARSQPYYLDVTHPDANKGAVVARLSKLLSVPTGEIATIGDMPNDVLMFRNSGLSIAMGNASPEVQKQANFVTDSYDDEGFAKAVERFILPRTGSALRSNASP